MVRYNFSAFHAFKITHHERLYNFVPPLVLSVLSFAKNVSKYTSVLTMFLFFAFCNAQPKKTIIISFNVLFKPNEKTIEKHVRESLSIFRAIGLLFSGIPSKEEIKRHLFSTLQEISLANISIDQQKWQTPYAPWDVDYAYPPILNQFVTSTTLEQEKAIYTKIVHHIRRHPHIGSTRKIILKAIADFLFQSQWMNKAMEPVPEMVRLMQYLKNEGHTLILISGTPGHAWDIFLKYAPQSQALHMLFSHDTMYVAGHKNILQTSPEMYALILEEHNLDPADCIVIAHNNHDLRHPKEMGMHTCVYTPQHNFENFCHSLKNFLTC